jgi:hypothetical protein
MKQKIFILYLHLNIYLITRKWLWKKVVFDNGVAGKNYHRYDHRLFNYTEGMGDNGYLGDVTTAINRLLGFLQRKNKLNLFILMF